ncbi:hypothetical protein niasHT_040021 [Heterodera trifolii]|uniref:Uncharacterized protein n=1 Tax=Heterodera trifolii TaxID=157864 RepID=A0ABD2J299_9BILA
MENCRTELTPINVLWLSSMLLALASVPFCFSVLALLITAKCWSTDGDGAGAFRCGHICPDGFRQKIIH